MFKLFVKLLVLVIVLAMAGPFFIRGSDGQPLISVKDVQFQLGNTGAVISRQWRKLTTQLRGDAKPVPIYRWQDADGNWHYSDEANPDGTSELIYIDPDKNVVPGSDMPADPKNPNTALIPGKMGTILKDTRDARQAVEDRNAQTQKRTEEER